MRKIRAAWNTDKTRSVALSKLKEFSIDDVPGANTYVVRGWYNKENYFSFGTFSTRKEAVVFLEEIHRNL